MSKRIIKLVLFVALCAVLTIGVLLTGCKTTTAETTAAATTAAAAATTAGTWVPTVGVAAPSAIAEASKTDFSGKTVNVLVLQGPQVSKPFLTYGKAWEEATGGKLNVIEVPYGDLYTKAATSFATGAAAYDLLVINPAWMGDWVPQGFLDPVPESVKTAVDLNDLLPVYSEKMLQWGGTLYAAPYDADDMFLYYRKDIINPSSAFNAEFKAKNGYDLNAPKTWKEFYEMAEFFNNKDWNNDGKPENGVAESQVRKAQSLYTFFAHAGAYAKNPASPYFFFDKNMDAAINNPGFVAALEDFIHSTKVGVPGMLGFGIGEIREAFVGGKVAFAVDWGDIGTIQADPKSSVVNGLVGYCKMPGAAEVWNMDTKSWDKPAQPNYGPYMAFGGWSIAVSANSQVKDAAWSVAAFMGNKDQTLLNDITPESGVNPGRISVFSAIDAWTSIGLSKDDAKAYLDAIMATLSDPNVIVDLRIPGTAEYQDIADREVSRALSGEITAQEALDNAAKEWNAVTERLGKAKQLEYYNASLNVK